MPDIDPEKLARVVVISRARELRTKGKSLWGIATDDRVGTWFALSGAPDYSELAEVASWVADISLAAPDTVQVALRDVRAGLPLSPEQLEAVLLAAVRWAADQERLGRDDEDDFEVVARRAGDDTLWAERLEDHSADVLVNLRWFPSDECRLHVMRDAEAALRAAGVPLSLLAVGLSEDVYYFHLVEEAE